MVAWGQNTVHTYPSAPGAAPATSFTFGGGAAPQQQQPSLFGGTTTPTSGGGLFGSPAPAAPTAPLFGGGGSLFGSSTTGTSQIFGTAPNTTGGFLGGFSSAAPPAAPQIPAHAALRAHLDASARNEHARVCRKMTRLYEAYTTGGTVPDDDDADEDMMTERSSRSHCFSTVLYNPATAQQLQFAAAAASVGGGSNSHSLQTLWQHEPKPAPLSTHDWRLAWIRNPDPRQYVPIVVTGAEALAARALAHPEQATAQWKEGWETLDPTVLTQRQARLRAQLAAQRVRHAQQGRRLWKLLKHVEVARCFHLPTTTAEYQGAQRCQHLLRHVVEQELEPAVTRLVLGNETSASRLTLDHRHDNDTTTPSLEQQQQWKDLLTQHRAQLQTLTEIVTREQHDLALIRDRVLGSDSQSSSQALPLRY